MLHDIDKVRVMIEEGININSVYDSETPLEFALRRSNFPAVELLLGCGADPTLNHVPWYVFNGFARTGQTHDVLKLLLERGLNCNQRSVNTGATLLLYAFCHVSLECVKLVLDYGADIVAVDRSGRTVLHYAANNERMDVLQFALDQVFDTEYGDANGDTALNVAIAFGNLAACELLLRNGANVGRRNDEGFTPLILALRIHADTAIVALLIEYGANAE